jgi:TfoX/Sxy family transcriptional regulator of competence genes
MPAKKRAMPKFTKAPEAMVALFASATSALPGIERRTMFSYPAAFINGNMFSCLFRSSMILKLSEADRDACTHEFGAKPFEPMPGRAMREYVTVPDAVLQSPTLLDTWLHRSYGYAASLPSKRAAKRTGTRAKAGPRKKVRGRQ